MTRPWPRVAMLAVLATLSTATARAEVQSGLPTLDRSELDYSAPKGCPGADQFLHEVNARAVYPRPIRIDTALRHVEVRIDRRRKSASGWMALPLREGGTARRHVQANSCGEVFAALALVTAVAFDAEADPLALTPMLIPSRPMPKLTEGVQLPTAAEQAESVALETREPSPEDDALATRTTRTDSEGWLPVADKPVDPVTAVFGPRTPRGWWAVGFHVGALGGVLPEVTFSPRLFVDARLDRTGPFTPSMRLSAARAEYRGRGTSADASGSVELSWTAGRTDLCPMSFELSETTAVWPCGTFEAGILSPRGTSADIAPDNNDPALWMSSGGVVRLQGILMHVILLELEAGAAAALVRPEFAMQDDARFFEPGLLSAYASAGVGGRFP